LKALLVSQPATQKRKMLPRIQRMPLKKGIGTKNYLITKEVLFSRLVSISIVNIHGVLHMKPRLVCLLNVKAINICLNVEIPSENEEGIPSENTSLKD
jgi:hypothetical protein